MDLGERDVHVWCVKLIGSDEAVAAFEKTLSAREADRCARFYQTPHRRAYAISHGVLRQLLGRYLGMAPEQIEFQYGRADKPELANASADLAFNMSHSGDLAVYAFARQCQLGVDVEHVRPLPDLELVAARFFGPEERSDLLALDGQERTHAFFRCWTRKEAFIKATGDGLSMRLDHFRVSLAPRQAALIHAEQGDVRCWHMSHLEPATDYVGAVAYDGVAREMRLWWFEGLPTT